MYYFRIECQCVILIIILFHKSYTMIILIIALLNGDLIYISISKNKFLVK